MARKSIERNISYDDDREKYYVTFNYGNNEGGKQIIKRKSFDKITDARKALKLFEGDKEKGNIVMPTEYTVSEWLDYWLENVVKPNKQETTYYGYKQMIDNHIKPYMGEIKIQSLKPIAIQQYYTFKSKEIINNKKPLSSNTIKKHHDLLKTALELAVRQEIILSNPISKVISPTARIEEAKFYTPDQMHQLFTTVEGDRLELVVKLIGYLGLRREEACGLTWENVNFEKKTLMIKQAMTQAGSKVIVKETKNRFSQRELHICNGLMDVLLKEKEIQAGNKITFGSDYNKENYVVVWANGTPYRPNFLSEMFTKFVNRNDLPPLTLHGLRHSYASTAIQAGVSIYNVARALGHNSIEMVSKRYGHLLDLAHKETNDKISKLYNEYR